MVYIVLILLVVGCVLVGYQIGLMQDKHSSNK